MCSLVCFGIGMKYLCLGIKAGGSCVCVLCVLCFLAQQNVRADPNKKKSVTAWHSAGLRTDLLGLGSSSDLRKSRDKLDFASVCMSETAAVYMNGDLQNNGWSPACNQIIKMTCRFWEIVEMNQTEGGRERERDLGSVTFLSGFCKQLHLSVSESYNFPVF